MVITPWWIEIHSGNVEGVMLNIKSTLYQLNPLDDLTITGSFLTYDVFNPISLHMMGIQYKTEEQIRKECYIQHR